MLDWHGDVAVVLCAAENGCAAGGIEKMNEEQQLKLQAFLDGELPEREAREILAWSQREASAASLLAELKNTRATLASAEPKPSLPETREFYWSKIEREIQKLEPAERQAAVLILNWQRLLWPIGAAAACFIVLMAASSRMERTAQPAVVADTDSPVVETMQSDSNATTYRDATDNTTLVWFSKSDDDSAQTPVATF
jgi:anti-sigma factor RsiW